MNWLFFTISPNTLGMIGSGEVLVIFLVVLVLFGPKSLPEIARMLGKATAELQRASRDFHRQVMTMSDEESEKAKDANRKPIWDQLSTPSAETKTTQAKLDLSPLKSENNAGDNAGGSPNVSAGGGEKVEGKESGGATAKP